MMNVNTFITKKNRLEDKVSQAENKLKEHLDTCSHPNLVYQKQGRSRDIDDYGTYWTVWQCDVCEQKWQTDQGKKMKETLEKYPHAKELDYYKVGYKL